MRPTYLDSAIKSVVLLGLPREQIVILDNGSAESVMSELKNCHHNNVVWLGSEENLGRGGNLTRALSLVKTKYFMILHDDDVLMPDFLTSQMPILESDVGLVAVSSNGYCIDETGSRTGKLVLANMPSHGARLFSNSSELVEHIFSDSCVPFSPMIYRSTILSQLRELFTPSFFTSFGPVCDVVMQMRLADAGGIFLNFSPLYECRVHPDQDSAYIDEKWNMRLRDYCYANVRGGVEDIARAQKKISHSYTCSVLYHCYKGVLNKRWRPKLRSILSSLQFNYLAFGGCKDFIGLIFKKINRSKI